MLYEPHPRGGLRVVAGGQSCGIRPGMPLAEATALSASLHLEPCDPLADRLALVELAEWCERFSPTVGIEAVERPDGLALDVSGLGPLFGGEETLARRVMQELRERGLSARVAIADTIGAAWGIAHYGDEGSRTPLPFREGPGEGRAIAPRSLSIIPPGQTIAALAPLPVATLRLPKETVELLTAVGIRTVGQVTALPRASLSTRFGPALLQRLDQATGRVPELLTPHRAAPRFGAEWLFESPIEHEPTVQHVLETLIGRVARSLAERQEGALGLACRIDGPNQEPLWLPIGLFRPSASARHLWELLRLRLEKVRLERPVSALRIEATATAGLLCEQQDLFASDRRRDGPRHLAALVDRLSNRLGRDAVARPCLLPDAQPEYASVDLPWTGGEGPGARGHGLGKNTRNNSPGRKARVRSGRNAHSAPADGRRSLPATLGLRPIWLYRRAAPLEVVSVVPDGPPAQFRFRGLDHRIARSWGPERIETGWWRTACVRRDYYRAETVAGNRFWLFRRLADGRWFLHGEFG